MTPENPNNQTGHVESAKPTLAGTPKTSTRSGQLPPPDSRTPDGALSSWTPHWNRSQARATPSSYFSQEQVEEHGNEDTVRQVSEYDPAQEFVVVLQVRRPHQHLPGALPSARIPR